MSLLVLAATLSLPLLVIGKPYDARIFALLLAEEELVTSPVPFDIYYATLKIAEQRVNQLYKDVVNVTVKIKRSPIRCDSRDRKSVV